MGKSRTKGYGDITIDSGEKMIVVLTAGYPYGGEPFLSTEELFAPEDLVYLALHPSQDAACSNRYQAFRIVESFHSPWNLWYGLRFFFDPIVWSELRWMRKKNKWRMSNFVAMAGRYVYGRRCAREIRHLLHQHNLYNEDTILYSYWMANQAITCAMLKRSAPKLHFYTRCHGYDIYEYRSRGNYLPFRGLIFSMADKILPISEDGVRYLTSTYPEFSKDKICLSRLGTVDHGLTPLKNDGERFRIVSCSSLISLKRVDRIIDALATLPLEFEWVHFGDGELADGLKKQAQRALGDKPCRYQFMGNVPNEQIFEYYRTHSVDVFLNVSETEGVPVSIMEAVSCGIPVIATDVGGTGEIVRDGFNGRLLSADFTTEELAGAIQDFSSLNDSERRSYRLQARKSWEERWTAEKNYKEFYRILQNRG